MSIYIHIHVRTLVFLYARSHVQIFAAWCPSPHRPRCPTVGFPRSCLACHAPENSGTSRGELVSVVQQSHIEPGAGCSVDVGTGSAGRGGSAEAENVGADIDD